MIDSLHLDVLILMFVVTFWDNIKCELLRVNNFLFLQRPSSIRIDQLDKQNCETEDALLYPLIIHHGNRPPQLSYAGDNT